MRSNSANVAVISLVVVSIILLFVIIILAAVYGTKSTPQYIYVETIDDSDSNVPASSTMRKAAGKRVRFDGPGDNMKRPTVLNYADEGSVLDLLNGDKLAMIMVYADWCGFCKKMHPVMDAIAASQNDYGITLAKINATDAAGLLEKFQIQGYPVLISNFGDKKYVGYKDEPSLRQLMQGGVAAERRVRLKLGNVNQARQQARMMLKDDKNSKAQQKKMVVAMKELMDEAQVDALLSDSSIPTLLMVFAEWCGYCKKMQAVFDELESYAIDNGIQLAKINYKNASELCKKNKINGFPAMLANFGDGKYSGYVDAAAMKKILNQAS